MKLQTRNYIFNYITLAIVIAFLLFAACYYLQQDEPLDFWSWSGLGLATISVVLFAVARIQLGSSFQASAEANKLVTTGIYSKIRNPVYIFGLTFLLGMILLTKIFWLILTLVVLIPMQLKRARNEERVLTEKFGEEYLEYRKRTWF
jgi:protein-S-isoprenylcysteine O-methyltransferase Ste14